MPETTATRWILRTQVHLPPLDGPVVRARLVEVPASDAPSSDWQASFWALFPRDQAEFAELVKTAGIGVTVDFPFMPSEGRKTNYGPYRAEKLERIWRHWSSQLSEAPPELRPLLEEFAKDRARQSHEEKGALGELVERRLPRPPQGYQWMLDSGGPRMGMTCTFLLWHRDFGYMPNAE